MTVTKDFEMLTEGNWVSVNHMICPDFKFVARERWEKLTYSARVMSEKESITVASDCKNIIPVEITIKNKNVASC